MTEFNLEIDQKELEDLLEAKNPAWKKHALIASCVGLRPRLETEYLPRIGESICYPFFTGLPEHLRSFLHDFLMLKVVDVIHNPSPLLDMRPYEDCTDEGRSNEHRTIIKVKLYWAE